MLQMGRISTCSRLGHPTMGPGSSVVDLSSVSVSRTCCIMPEWHCALVAAARTHRKNLLLSSAAQCISLCHKPQQWQCIMLLLLWLSCRADPTCFLGFTSFLSAFLFSIETQNTIGKPSHSRSHKQPVPACEVCQRLHTYYLLLSACSRPGVLVMTTICE